ncbi:MAG: PrkA family serine protein kinase [Hydrogenibacillus schlegelii]|uniref:PrkA family serine protein kinase n=1 Tax=Hydrogenibacillus schlegelii TaxID=1484 RepID=A0A947D0B9_HYDSH|nr:PrkA family serine protein kinase [Hydrogenibacillus schlegelii]
MSEWSARIGEAGGPTSEALGRLWSRLGEYYRREESLRWEGTFAEYLEIVRRSPHVADSAHRRIYRMIVDAGVEEVDGRKRYRFFSDELFGLDETLDKLVEEYFHAAAMRLDVRKRLLLLMGPVAGGKSTIVTLLKRGLERYTRTEAGAVYGLQGCPMHEEPLHLVPHELRPEFEAALGVRIEGELCPVCRHRLDEEYGGDIRRFRVERVLFSEAKRVGIGTFSPSDPKSQDIAELTGSIDLATITEYGVESDPRAYRFDGELNVANRGLMEFQEILKSDEKFLWHLLSLTQEGNFKAGRFALISADELVVAHTNEAEYRRFVADKKNEALQSRMIVLRVPYNLKVREEERIYEKLIRQSDLRGVHIAPHALYTAAFFSILTRLKPSKRQGIDLVKKLRLYGGEAVEGLSEADLRELRAEHDDEGMSGIDPRYVINRISSALIRRDADCINALDVLRAIKDGLDQHPSITKEERERYLEFIALARQEYDEIAKREVQKAFVYSFEEAAQAILNNYLDNIEAWSRRQKLRDPITGEEVEPDERLMRSIEEQIGVSESAKKAFREEILIRISAYARKGRPFTYDSHERLKEAIERKLFADLKDTVRITTSSVTPDEEQLRKVNEVSRRLIDEYGYCATCANELLRYVGGLLNR